MGKKTLTSKNPTPSPSRKRTRSASAEERKDDENISIEETPNSSPSVKKSKAITDKKSKGFKTKTLKPKKKKKRESPSSSLPKTPKFTRAKERKSPDTEPSSTPSPKLFLKNYTRTHADKGKWVDEFGNKNVSLCQKIDINFIARTKLAPLIRLRDSSAIRLGFLPGTAFPRLVRLFYLNMKIRFEDEKIFLDSNVDGFDLVVDADLLSHILEIPIIDTSKYPTRTHSAGLARETFIKDFDPLSKKHLTQAQLKLGPKIIHAIITRTIMPRNTSREFLSDQSLEVLWLILNGQQIDLPSIILKWMIHAKNSKRSKSLPYANLLTLIFWHYDLVREEEEELTDNSEFNERSINHLGFFKVMNDENEEWKSREELSSDEIASIPFLKNRTLTPIPHSSSQSGIKNLEEHLSELEWEVDSLRAEMIDFKIEMCSKLDKVLAALAVQKEQGDLVITRAEIEPRINEVARVDKKKKQKKSKIIAADPGRDPVKE